MRKRWFYRVDGSRVKVSQREWERRTKLQNAAIARSGRQVWRTRRNRVKSVTTSEHKQLSAKREIAKRASRIGWDVVRSIKRAAKRPTVQGRRVFVGPTAEIDSREGYGAFRAVLFDMVVAAIAADGRDGNLVVLVEMSSRIISPDADDPGSEMFPMPFAFVVDGRIKTTVGIKIRFFHANLSLFNGVKGLVMYPKRLDEMGEVELGEFLEGQPIDAKNVGEKADPGYYAIVTSNIIIRPGTLPK